MLALSSPSNELQAHEGVPSRAGGALCLEALDVEAAAKHVGEWQRLADEALEPNAFLKPEFALSAARHLAKGGAPHFLFVWDAPAGVHRRLLAVCPLAPFGRLTGLLPLRVWTHVQAPLGTPLLHRAHAAATLAAIFSYCHVQAPRAAALLFPLLPETGPVAQLLKAYAGVDGLRIFDAHRRGVLCHGADPERFLEQGVSGKWRRNHNVARRRLEATGKVRFHVLREPASFRRAIDDFLMLEAQGWKGRRGTALLKHRENAAFARALADERPKQDRSFAVSLDLDGRPIAMAIILVSGDRAFCWKIAYDESFAAFSPGVLLTVELSRALLADDTIALTDSCCTAKHPMIDHLWRDRMAVADFLVATPGAGARRFATAVLVESLRRSLRSHLKSMVLRLRRWAHRPK